MKMLLLASGLGKSCRGYERFVLDMAAELCTNGLEVACWGSGDGPGILSLPIIGREELESLALDRVRQDPKFTSFARSELHDWTLHTEDQLFGIAAAVRLRQENGSGQPAIVYLKWQGGLVDAGGKSTALLELVDRAAKDGSFRTVIHTDWVWAPVIQRLAEAGVAFHSIAPWVTRQLREVGVPSQSLFELPMGTRAKPLQNVRSQRESSRRTFGVPENAFVVLSVGAFDNEVKNYPYLVRELASLARDKNFYWVVAGSRGTEPAAWEEQARSLFGPRFVPMVGVPFEQMPAVYAVGDVFVCASLNETFGLAYVEAQLAGLPCVMHDYHVTQWITAGWPVELAPITRVDMRTPGAASEALAKWRMLLADPGGRKAVYEITDRFRMVQEERFGWEKLGSRYAEAFRRTVKPNAPTTANPDLAGRSSQCIPTTSEPRTPSAASGPSLRILIVNDVLPQPDRNGSDVRLMQVLRELLAQSHRLTFLAKSGYQRARYTPALQSLGIKVWSHDSERLRYLGVDSPVEWTLSQVLEEGEFDLAILFMWFWSSTSVPEHYMEEIRRLSPRTRIAVLTDDQHGLREQRMAELTGQWPDYERAEDYAARELEVYRRADLVLCISEDDRRGLLKRAPDLKIGLLPMVAEIAPAGPGFHARSDLLFLGNFANPANLDAVKWMLTEIWPGVQRALPAVHLALVGSHLPADIADQHQNVRAVGHVADLDPLFAQHRVFVSPIRFGTGIKTKNLSALAHGTPLVTTTVGAEGMHLSDGSPALIADTADSFVEAVVRCYSDEKLWQKLACEGRQHIAIEFGYERLKQAVRSFIEKAVATSAKPHDPLYESSFFLVEKLYPQVLTSKSAAYRTALRVFLQTAMAEELLRQHRPGDALTQLRHIFSSVRQPVSTLALFRHVQQLLACCYYELGEGEKAASYERQTSGIAPACLVNKPPDISVIIPAYNRKSQLQACLAHLATQTLPADRWEVIVVDDGSSDDVEAAVRTVPSCFQIEFIRQEHAGAGAARRAAIERARGEYLLLVKDDTIPYNNLLAEHLAAHVELRSQKVVILGERSSPRDAADRALTYFWAANPLLFAEPMLPLDLQKEKFHFFAHNLSVCREAVLAAGSFDPDFRHGEDVELGVRLRDAGYRVQTHSSARSDHNHLNLTVDEFASKARICGLVQFQLFRKHRRLLGDGSGPFGKLDDAVRSRIEALVAQNTSAAQQHAQSLAELDRLDFRRCLAEKRGRQTRAEEIMTDLKKWVPVTFWFHFFKGFLEAWTKEEMHFSASV